MQHSSTPWICLPNSRCLALTLGWRWSHWDRRYGVNCNATLCMKSGSWLRDDLIRLKDAGLRVRLIVHENILTQLALSQRDELAVLTTVTGAKVYFPATNPETEEAHHRLPRVMEIGNDQHAIRWASSNAVP